MRTFLSCLLFCSISTIYAQDLKFDNLVLQSGTDNLVGAVYKQTLAAPGIDAVVTIVDLTGGTTLQTFDDNGAVPDAFQPIVIKSGVLADEYARFQFDFYVTGTGTPVDVASAEINAVDVDGCCGLYEYVTFYDPNSYTLETPTNLTIVEVANGVRFQGPYGGPPGIDYSATDYIAKVNYSTVQSITIDLGSDGMSAFPTRYTSVYFKSIAFSSPLVIITSEDGLCGNAFDDDGDGLTDCDDPDCGVSVTNFYNGQPAIDVYGQPNLTTGGSGLSDSEFFRPNDIEADPSTGKIFVVDQFNHRILRYASIADLLNDDPAEVVLGQMDFITGTSGLSQSEFNTPHSIAIDASGSMFVSDLENNRILRFDNASAKTTGANADGVLGQINFTSSGSGLAQNKLQRPAGIHVDNAGTLWIADGYNNRIIKHLNAAAKADGANADGVLGKPDYTFTPTACTQSLTGITTGLSMYNGSLYVGDSNHKRIMIWDDADSKSDGANADRVLGQTDFVTSSYTLSQSSISSAHALSFDIHGNLYVSDGRILIFQEANSKSNGANGDIVLGQPDFVTSGWGTSATQLFSPYGTFHFEYNNQTYLACADKLNHRIIFWTQFVSTDELTSVSGTLHGVDLAGSGSLTYAISQQPDLGTVTIDNASTGAYTYTPTGQCMLDNDSILSFEYSLTNGNGCSELATIEFHVSDVNPCVEICGNALDDDLDGLVDCDDPDCGVFQLDFDNGQAATYVWGQPNFTSGSNGLSSTKLDNPTCIIEDPSTGKVFVGEYNNYRVLRFNSVEDLLNGTPAEAVLGQADFTTQTIATTQNGMSSVAGLAINSSGTLFVSDFGNRRILRFDNAASKANGANADGVLGQPDFVTKLSTLAQNGMDCPYGIFLEEDGTLWATDFDNWRVLRYDNAAAKSNGANADGVLGAPDFTTKTDLPVSTMLRRPLGLTVYQGTLYVSDIFRYRILGWDDAKTKANGASPDQVLGQPDFTSTAYSISQSSVGYVHAMSVDDVGSLYLSDGTADRVTIFNDVLNKADGANADRVLGQPDFVTTGSGLSATTLNNPEGSMVFDYNGNTYFALTEYWNDRIMIWTLSVSTNELTDISGVLDANDLAGTGSLTFSVVSQPAAGTVTIDNASTGAFTYSPIGPCTVDNDSILTFTYQVVNGNACSTNGVLEIHVSDIAPCEEICGNAIDDDWDGRTDEGYPGGVNENCILWLKASDGFTGATWEDQSREENDATVFGDPSSVANSMNFNPGINFDGDDHVEVNLPELRFDGGTHHVVIFAVYKPSTAATNIGIYGNQSASDVQNLHLQWNQAGNGSGSEVTFAPFGTNPHLVAHIIDEEDNVGGAANGSKLYHNGILDISYVFDETSLAGVDQDFHIGKGGSHPSASKYFQGDMCELIIYYENDGNSSITDAERQKIESYLATKYGISLSHDYSDSQ